MIRVKISIGIIAAIIILGVFGFFTLKRETNQVIESIDKIRELSEAGKIEEALDSADIMLKEWEKYHTYASIFVNNDKITVVQNSISRLRALIEDRNDELGAEFDTAKSGLKWIVESEIPRFTNIM